MLDNVCVKLNVNGAPIARSKFCTFETFVAICTDDRLKALITTAATPAAVPEAHSLGCSRVTDCVRNEVAIDFPATSKLGAPATVRARKGIKKGTVEFGMRTVLLM